MTAAPAARESAALVVAGPTGVGKSEIAVALAERCGGEIVGADAYQVYAGLDLLTAKPDAALRARVPHHLIGEIPLGQSFDVAQYERLARARMREIRARGRTPVIVGGTGLYLRALLRGLADLPPADPALRTELERRAPESLVEELHRLDPEGAPRMDLQNPRRVIRALEVCLLTGRPFSTFRQEWQAPAEGPAGVSLERTREDLHARIDRRVEAMFESGVLEEVRQAAVLGPTASQTLGLRDLQSLLAGEIARAECLARIQLATRQYAKRQRTWLRREPQLRVVSLAADTPPSPAAKAILAALTAASAKAGSGPA